MTVPKNPTTATIAMVAPSDMMLVFDCSRKAEELGPFSSSGRFISWKERESGEVFLEGIVVLCELRLRSGNGEVAV
jgi:hypothetical protein